ncbi:MAG: winged helix-turn-helix domain-containing protein [Clostridiales bacterium]|nr:winged helix-turn-helix domain-containing protein [Clostridiales bacterium]
MTKRAASPDVEANIVPIRAVMLGDFKLYVGDVLIDEEVSRSHKMWNLLAYLIIHRNRNVPQEELIEVLWPEDNSQNPGNALKTLLYRTRATVLPLLGDELQLILSQRGSYSWNHTLTCDVDAEDFAVLARQASNRSLSDEERRELYREAISLYNHDFLPKLAEQLWVIPLSAYYHTLYLDAVSEYSQLLFKMEQYAELARLINEAIKIEPYDDKLHALLITAQLRQGNSLAALNHYDSATELLYRNLGVRPSEELRALYHEIMQERKNLEMDLDVIQKDLQEAASRPGAFVCDYGFFREAYRLEARRAGREGTCVHVALVTVSLPDGKTPALKPLNATMDQLLEAMRINLRRGDVLARYSGAQYVLMLPTANYEDSQMVLDRIVSSFYQQNRKSFLKISYKLQQLDLVQLLSSG